MAIAQQQCRVCGVEIPSGFTNCDACYHQPVPAKVKKPASSELGNWSGHMRRVAAAVIFVACAATLAGCETMKGAGKDIEDAGQNIQKSAS